MDIGRAFDALQEGAASSSQVKEQWHSMVAQVRMEDSDGRRARSCQVGERDDDDDDGDDDGNLMTMMMLEMKMMEM
eukprot:755482-Hanusia_phi.AAC.3